MEYRVYSYYLQPKSNIYFFQIQYSISNSESQRIRSIYPEIQRAIENEIIIGNIEGQELIISHLKKVYNIKSLLYLMLQFLVRKNIGL